MNQVQYQGYIIDEQGVHVELSKMQVIFGLANLDHSNRASQLYGPCQFL